MYLVFTHVLIVVIFGCVYAQNRIATKFNTETIDSPKKSAI